jgi:hypothetical protein
VADSQSYTTPDQIAAFLHLKAVAKAVLDHVEDVDAPRVDSQCTLCYSYRSMLREAIERAEVR